MNVPALDELAKRDVRLRITDADTDPLLLFRVVDHVGHLAPESGMLDAFVHQVENGRASQGIDQHWFQDKGWNEIHVEATDTRYHVHRTRASFPDPPTEERTIDEYEKTRAHYRVQRVT